MSKIKRPQIGVGLIIQKDDSILLGIRESDFGNGKLSLPGGKLELYETTEECARREALEECGLKVGKVELIGFTEDLHPDEDKHYLTVYYVGQYVSGEPKENEPHKIGNWKWYPISELKNLQPKIWKPCIEKFRKLGWL